jgi:hypothetical protein
MRNVFVYAGANAQRAAAARVLHCGIDSVLVLPPGENFRNRRWAVSGLDLMLIWPDGSLDDVRAFGEHLIHSGAQLVVAPHPEIPDGSIYIQPMRRAA